MKDRRFNVVKSEGSSFSLKSSIIVDEVTGVNYLMVTGGYGMAVTPLLDGEGKPIVTRPIVGRDSII